jgi:hypothetical protein
MKPHTPHTHRDAADRGRIELCTTTSSRVLHNDGLQTLGLAALDIDGLHVAVQLLLGILLVVALSRDAHAQSVGDALDAGFPDALVQLRVEADVVGTLSGQVC